MAEASRAAGPRVTIEGWEKSYPTIRVMEQRWNGWACPVFDEATAREIAADYEAKYGAEGDETETLVANAGGPGEFLVYLREYDGETPDGNITAIYGPDEFPIGAFGWCWIEDGRPSSARVETEDDDDLQPRPVEERIECAIRLGIAQILNDVARGIIPALPTEFAGLHDYVDANEYGGLTEENSDLIDENAFDGDDDPFVHARAVQNGLDAWLKDRAKNPNHRADWAENYCDEQRARA